MWQRINIIYVCIIFFIPFLSYANENDICLFDDTEKIKIGKELNLCFSSKGISVNHFNIFHNFKFINHLETQYYIINSLPSGFLCRDGIFVGPYLPPTKYQPKNGIYIYRLNKGKHGLEPIMPAVPEKFKIRDFIIKYSQIERRKQQALALVIYNGDKNVSTGQILLFPKNNKNVIKFNLNKCRVEMTDLAKEINRFTRKRN